MKFKFLTASITTLLLSSASIAADIEQGVATKNLKSNVDEFMGAAYDVAGPYNGLESTYIPQSKTKKSELAQRAPAQGITSFEIGIVFSTNVGYESIPSSAFSTTNNHGGANLFIYAWQFGYGNPTNATMNGVSRSLGLSEPRCGSDLHVCSSGETVTGFLYGWDFSGQESGQVVVSSNSIASPFGYWSDSLNIQ